MTQLDTSIVDDRDIDRSAAKLKRFGKDFDLHRESIIAYEAEKTKRLNNECPACHGSGKKDSEWLEQPYPRKGQIGNE